MAGSLFDLVVEGDEEVTLRFTEIPVEIHAALSAKVTELTDQLDAAVLARIPEVVHVRTGRLESAVHKSITDTDTRILGRVYVSGVDKYFAEPIEFGFQGVEQVRAHSARLDHLFGEPMPSTEVEVDAFARNQDQLEHSFLRTPFDELEAGFLEQLEETVATAAGESP